MEIQVEIRKFHALIQKLLFWGNSVINVNQSVLGIVYYFNQSE